VGFDWPEVEGGDLTCTRSCVKFYIRTFSKCFSTAWVHFNDESIVAVRDNPRHKSLVRRSLTISATGRQHVAKDAAKVLCCGCVSLV